MVVSVETNGEVGERASVTIVLNCLHHTFIGDDNEDCAVNIGWIQVHSEPFFSGDCVVEAG